MPDLVIRARRAVMPDGIRPVAVRVSGEQIVAVTALEDGVPGEGGGAAGEPAPEPGGLPSGGAAVIDLAADEVLLPGLVDTHVHVNEPGRTDWEGFATATRAAAAGGVTTLLDMPLNALPPTVDAAALEKKRAAAEGQCYVDVGFWGGAIPANPFQRPELHAAGVFGFKCFLTDSGVPEFPPLGQAGLATAIRQVAELDSLLIVHAEDADTLRRHRPADQPGAAGQPLDYAGFLRSRPEAAEVNAVNRLIDLARTAGARVHVLHLSAAAAMPAIAEAQAGGVAITAETCPHYLALAAEQIGPKQTIFKCCPPIRDRANQDRLWLGLVAGVIGAVVSDHSPCPPEAKRLAAGDFSKAWGGISSIQYGLPVVWTRARELGLDLTHVADWMAAGPAAIARVSGKGAIAPGNDADLVAFAPDEVFTVDPALARTRHKLTPYAGHKLTGVVRRTWLRGTEVTDDRPRGRLLTRGGTGG